MEALVNTVSNAITELLGRTSGPLHIRLLIQPLMATFFAVRAGLRDAREGRPAFLWTILTDPRSRREFLRSGWRDISKFFAIAMVLDAAYQAIVLQRFLIVQALIVAIVVAVIPYCLIRGPAKHIASLRRHATGQLGERRS